MPSFRRGLAVLLCAALSGCGGIGVGQCRGGERFAVQDWLYFGTQMPVGAVTAQDWARFLAAEVTPRFSDGLTVWRADGQWRAAGAVVKEPAYVLSLVHTDGDETEDAVLTLIAAYKTRFRQQAVLRVKSYACLSY